MLLNSGLPNHKRRLNFCQSIGKDVVQDFHLLG